MNRTARSTTVLATLLLLLACSSTPREERVKIAVVQCSSRMGDVERNRSKLARLVREAAANGAKIVVLPEAAISGYVSQDLESNWHVEGKPLDPGFGGRHPERVAEQVPGKSTDLFCDLARELEIFLTIPLVEEADELLEPDYYDTVCLASPEGEIVAHHRKLEPERGADRSWAEPGDLGLAIVDTEYGRVGIAIGQDVELVLERMKPRRVWAVLHPSARISEGDPADWFGRRLPGRAAAFGVYFACANWSVERDQGWRGHGHSFVASPRGEILASAKTTTGDEILYADIVTSPPLD